ncbi:MAG TPA: RIP metalloprotease RseP [Candidatus Kapabacteria bacterium]|nr:RIP metalloprotease RseP [Candidatus Kapabacteria bacterium]
MSDIFFWIYVSAAVVLLFGAAVFVHEWGHYYMARKRGLKVEAFAIGFGPKIFGWRKDGIDYSWRWIPAGGFVRIPQMITSEALEGKGEEPLPPAPPFSKILVAFAGPFMNIVFAFVIAGILYFTGLPVLIDPSVVGYVDPTSAEGKLGIRDGDRIVMVNGKPTKSWQDVQEATIFATVNPIPVVLERDGVRNQYNLEAKTSPLIGGKYLNLDSRDHPLIDEVREGPAKRAGAMDKDLVVEYAGVKIAGVKQLRALIAESGGQPTPMVVKRGEERVELLVTPEGEKGKGLLNVMLGSSAKNIYEVQKPGPKPWVAIGQVIDKTFATLNAVFFRSKETGVGPSDLSGPIGIFAMLAREVSVDYRLALNFLLLLNVNLAILNLLPLPVLDGGHIVMSLIERIIRRPLPVKIQEYATTAFAVVLISFMLFVSFHDIKRFKLFRAMFQQENQVGGGQTQQEATPGAQPAPAPAP